MIKISELKSERTSCHSGLPLLYSHCVIILLAGLQCIYFHLHFFSLCRCSCSWLKAPQKKETALCPFQRRSLTPDPSTASPQTSGEASLALVTRSVSPVTLISPLPRFFFLFSCPSHQSLASYSFRATLSYFLCVAYSPIKSIVFNGGLK